MKFKILCKQRSVFQATGYDGCIRRGILRSSLSLRLLPGAATTTEVRVAGISCMVHDKTLHLSQRKIGCEYGPREVITQICLFFWFWHLAARWSFLKCYCYNVTILPKDTQSLSIVCQLKLPSFHSVPGRGRRGLNGLEDTFNGFARKQDKHIG